MTVFTGRLLASDGRSGRKWPGLFIKAGQSKNPRNFTEEMLREAAAKGQLAPRPVNSFPLLDSKGRPIVFDHVGPEELQGKSPLNMVGWTENARWSEADKAIVGDIVLMDGNPFADAIQRHLEALEAQGRLDLIGLSIDALGPMTPDGTVLYFEHVSSVDIVSHPAAGGQIGHRIAASRSIPHAHRRAEPMTFLDNLKKRWPRLTEGLSKSDTEKAIVTSMARRLKEMMGVEEPPVEQEIASLASFIGEDVEKLKKVGPEKVKEHLESALAAVKALMGEGGEEEEDEGGKSEPIKESRPNGAAASVEAELARLREAREKAEKETEKARRDRSKTLLQRACESRKLDAKSTAMIGLRLGARILESEEEADRFAKEEQEYLDSYIDRSRAAGVAVVRESADNARDILAHMFSPSRVERPKTGLDNIGFSLRRFNEAFFGIKHDMLTGPSADRRRVREAVDDTNFDQVYADALNRAFLAEYVGFADYQSWRKLVRIASFGDFRSHKVINTGYYGFLPDVAKKAPYLALTTPTDKQETIALAKKGGTETIAWEDMINDDLGVWQDMVRKLGLAAAETIFDAVLSQIRDATQPTMSDSLSLTSSGRSPVNEGTAALTADATGKTNFINSVTAMMKGTGGSGQKKGVRPRYCIIPFEKLEAFAYVSQALKGGVTGTDMPEAIARVLGLAVPDPIIDYGTSNTTDWYLVADPAQAEVIRVGFLNGNENPEIFVADDERFGSMFTRDSIELKIRHVYAVAAVDPLGIYGNDAAT